MGYGRNWWLAQFGLLEIHRQLLGRIQASYLLVGGLHTAPGAKGHAISQRCALTLVRLAHQATGPGRFRSFALEICHVFTIRQVQARKVLPGE